MRSLVLRYSDQEAPTVPLHLSVLERHESVWWGWWKKDFEPDRLGALEQFRGLVERSPVVVGLLNRKDEIFHRAICAEVVWSPDGSRIACPDHDMCPDYYKTERCAAWFRFTDISSISSNDYTAQFGPMPVGEPTLYEIVNDARSGLRAIPAPAWNMAPVEMPGDLVVHVSDLHFGESHAFDSRAHAPGTHVRTSTLADKIKQSVDLNGSVPGALVLSGDLISKGHTDDFDLVESFLDNVVPGLGLTNDHVIVVPGNHDFKVIAENEQPTVDYRHERAFRRFLAAFRGEPNPEIERLHHLVSPSGWTHVFAALNSARLRGDQSKEYGYVGRHRYESMLKYACDCLGGGPSSRSKSVGIAVLHHHLLPVQDVDHPASSRPLSLTVDAGEVCTELQRHGFRVALHGHQHMPFLGVASRSVFEDDRIRWPAERSPLIVAGGGSAGAAVGNLGKYPFNTVSMYAFRDPANFDVEIWRYSAQHDPLQVLAQTFDLDQASHG